MNNSDRINNYLYQNNCAMVTWNINPRDVWAQRKLTPAQMRRANKRFRKSLGW